MFAFLSLQIFMIKKLVFSVLVVKEGFGSRGRAPLGSLWILPRREQLSVGHGLLVVRSELVSLSFSWLGGVEWEAEHCRESLCLSAGHYSCFYYDSWSPV